MHDEERGLYHQARWPVHHWHADGRCCLRFLVIMNFVDLVSSFLGLFQFLSLLPAYECYSSRIVVNYTYIYIFRYDVAKICVTEI